MNINDDPKVSEEVEKHLGRMFTDNYIGTYIEGNKVMVDGIPISVYYLFPPPSPTVVGVMVGKMKGSPYPLAVVPFGEDIQPIVLSIGLLITFFKEDLPHEQVLDCLGYVPTEEM